MKMRILLVGVGAMGSVIAAKLLAAGKDLTLLTGRSSTTETLKEKGLHIRTPEEEVWVRPEKVFTTPAELTAEGQRFDSIWLLTKATALDALLPDLQKLLSSDGFFVSFQNGMVAQSVCERVGQARMVPAILGWGATLHAPGRAERTSGGKTWIGEFSGPPSTRVGEMAALLSLANPTQQSGNMLGVLWSKLAINCTITSMGALSGEPLGSLLKNRKLRNVFLALYREVVDVAEAKGVILETIAAPPKMLYLPQNAGPLRRQSADLLLQAVGIRYSSVRASMLQSLERGQKTEIDFLNGFVVREGKKVGVATPANHRLWTLINDIEAGRRTMGEEALAALFSA